MSGNDGFYKEALEHCRTFNSRLMTERRVRLPYLDSQTRVAQSDCCLWFKRRHRGPGLKPNQVYCYPSKRWKKRPRFTPLVDPSYEAMAAANDYKSMLRSSDVPHHLINENSNDSSSMNTITSAMIDADNEMLDNVSNNEDNGAIDEDEDFEDFENGKSKKKGRKSQFKAATRSGRKSDVTTDDKYHTCDYCGKKYKNKTGLNYHVQHVHQDELDADEEYTPSGRHSPSSIMSDDHHSTSSRTSAIAAQKAVAAAVADISEVEIIEPRPKRKRQTQSNNYCDFCLGDADENKKTGESEELVSCSDCGRSGHPTCLQFTDIMTMNVKKYSWQCIECKSCHVCGTSDNDEQLLFCDDCDRGYHMYCLQPRMENPPEGSWICNLCENDRKEREKLASHGTLSL
uniref:Zinc finger protein n=1 Tax=Ciona intestinalis TaxID=7719 RepID=H2XVS3_CIOIN|nr:zinc finger protein isoform X1 [Ciona intestinalis]|eukprot:XP_018669421.1 zinc finger protein isoform X1 [Ciona intestinalis]